MRMAAIPGAQTVPRAEAVAANFVLADNLANSSTPFVLDASYVSDGLKRRHVDRCSFLRNKNGDLWHELYGIHDVNAPAATRKVTSHSTFGSITAGHISWQDYIGNSVADFAADAMAKACQPQGIVLQHAEQWDTYAFVSCLRAAIIEKAHTDLVPRLVAPPVLPPEPQPVSCEQHLLEMKSRVDLQGHRVVASVSGKGLKCIRCQEWSGPTGFLSFASFSCVASDPFVAHDTTSSGQAGIEQEAEEELGAKSGCTIDDFDNDDIDHFPAVGDTEACVEHSLTCESQSAPLLITRARRKQLVFANTKRIQQIAQDNKRNARAAKHRCIGSVAPTCPAVNESQLKPREVAPAIPPWVQRVHASHRISYAGGLTGCSSCGAIAQRPQGLLLAACRNSVPLGSQSRFARFISGHLLTGNRGWPAWPDGLYSPDTVRSVFSLQFTNGIWQQTFFTTQQTQLRNVSDTQE